MCPPPILGCAYCGKLFAGEEELYDHQQLQYSRDQSVIDCINMRMQVAERYRRNDDAPST